MRLEFAKMHGLGNDFVFIEDLSSELDLHPDVVARICDRHFGIGADGVILVRQAREDDGAYYMHYFNADGSLAEMCGNGIRCLAKYVLDAGLLDADSFTVHTLGGPKHITVSRDDAGAFVAATVNMGTPSFAPHDIPVKVEGDYAQDCALETPYGDVRFTAVSMGNPHAVIFVDDVDTAPVDTVGPFVETHEIFPHKTNVEFVQVLPDDVLCVRVWERGVGETLACGTGACAATVAASMRCAIGKDATVRLTGGELHVRWEDREHVLMSGPASEVFRGSIDIGDQP